MCLLKYLIEKIPRKRKIAVIQIIMIGMPMFAFGKRIKVTPQSPKMLSPRMPSAHIRYVAIADPTATIK